MLSKRLKCIADLVDKNTFVIDVGCDHGLLDVYLARQGFNCLACDISLDCINKTKENVIKYQVSDNVKPVLTDGLNGIIIPENTCLIMSGLGAQTIIDILDKRIDSKIKCIILQSNNHLDKLRYEMMKCFHLEDEVVIKDKGIYYVIMKWVRGSISYSKKELYLGPVLLNKKDSKNYYKFLLLKNKRILNKIPSNYIEKINEIELQNKYLEEVLTDL